MGARTDVAINCREQDKNLIEKVMTYVNDDHVIGKDGIVEFYMYDVNNGGQDEVNELVSNGIVFNGNHGVGSEYMPMSFAHDGETFAEAITDMQGNVLVRFKNGIVNKADAKEAMEFEQVNKNVLAIFKRK
jgi:hypothetical protein